MEGPQRLDNVPSTPVGKTPNVLGDLDPDVPLPERTDNAYAFLRRKATPAARQHDLARFP
jgi:hypothetical protein